MRYKNIFLASCLTAIVAVPVAMGADSNETIPDPAKVQDIANHLSAFEEQAAQVSLDAETIRSLSQDHHSNWQSHVYYLNNLREDVNSMGKLLAELKEKKSQRQRSTADGHREVPAALGCLGSRDD